VKARVRLGMIGCGRIASAVHLRVLGSIRGAELAAVADLDPEARGRAERSTRAAVYEREEELVADPCVDAIVICSPPDTHARLTIAAAEAGKHVYVEKPIATDVDDAAAALAAVERAGTIGVIGFNRRWHPAFEQGRRLLAAGRIGRVRAVQTVFCEPMAGSAMPDWKRCRRTGGGVLLDLASHHFDLLRWLLDDEFESVEADLRSELSEDDSAWVEARLAGGVEARSFFSFRAGTADYLEFIGERGVLRLDRYVPPALLTLKRDGLQSLRRSRPAPTPSLLAWRLRRIVRPANEPSYRRSLTRFVRVLQGTEVDLPTLVDGVRSLEAVLAAEDSARARSPVSV
jgi:myo-inositol 2-dehydrogenase / D-chiro-inositol 1-dehydrogenase